MIQNDIEIFYFKHYLKYNYEFYWNILIWNDIEICYFKHYLIYNYEFHWNITFEISLKYIIINMKEYEYEYHEISILKFY